MLNLGGVANVTWIGGCGFDDIRACDTGPASALLDDFVKLRTGNPWTRTVNWPWPALPTGRLLPSRLNDPYFPNRRPNPSTAAIFAAFSTKGHLSGRERRRHPWSDSRRRRRRRRAIIFPAAVKRWLVTGGGRHNQALMAGLRAELDAPVEPVEAVGWNGDALEAQAFAYLAVRSVKGLPLSVPGSTGVVAPVRAGGSSSP